MRLKEIKNKVSEINNNFGTRLSVVELIGEIYIDSADMAVSETVFSGDTLRCEAFLSGVEVALRICNLKERENGEVVGTEQQ